MSTTLFSADRLPGRLLRLPLGLIPRGSVVPILATSARGKRWIAGSGPHSCWLGWNEIHKRQLFTKEVRAGGVVYDIGANVGSYSILSSVLVGSGGQVWAFEPLPENIAFLRRHIRLNRLQNVRVVEAAVADRTGKVRFEAHSDRVRGRISDAGSAEVRAVAIDDLIASGEVPRPDTIKIDVEGGEVAVLLGAEAMLKRARPVIFLATHGDSLRRECHEILHRAGYEIAQIGSEEDEWIARPGEDTEARGNSGHARIHAVTAGPVPLPRSARHR